MKCVLLGPTVSVMIPHFKALFSFDCQQEIVSGRYNSCQMVKSLAILRYSFTKTMQVLCHKKALYSYRHFALKCAMVVEYFSDNKS